MNRHKSDVLSSIAILVVFIGLLVFSAVLLFRPAQTQKIPAKAPLVVQYEVCMNTSARATAVAVQEYALCVQAVKSTWQDERNWK